MEQNTEVMTDTTPTEAEGQAGTEAESTSTPTDGQNAKVNAELNADEIKPLKIRFKHKDIELNSEDAINYAQKGMKYDEIAPMLDDLSYLATIKDKKPHELLKEFIRFEEENYRESLIERVGDDEEAVEALMEKYRNGNKSKFEKAQSDLKKAEEEEELKAVEALEGRIATEFGELSQNFPEIKSITDVPHEVLKEAEKGTKLYYAYLAHRHKEGQKVDKAKQTANVNSKSTAGSMSASGDTEDGVLSAFLNGLRT